MLLYFFSTNNQEKRKWERNIDAVFTHGMNNVKH